MTHLSDERIYTLVFEAVAPAADEAAHLEHCSACAALAGGLRTLATSLAVAGRSLPSPAALERARALAATIAVQPAQNPLQRVGNWLRATLAVDTRRTVTGGVRGGTGAYRLLYTTETTDVELHVAQQNGSRRIEGEILPAESAAGGSGDEIAAQPALVQLTRAGGNAVAHVVAEVETSADGRFRLDAVAPGAYRLWIAFADAHDLVIEEMEIA